MAGKINSIKFRQVINKHAKINENLLEEKLDIVESDVGSYAYLNECIADSDPANFKGLKESPEGEFINPSDSTYTIDYDCALIAFAESYTIPRTLYAYYWGGGSVIWADDVNKLNNAVKIIDNNTVYSDGSVAMQGNLNLNTHALTNVTTLNNININTHKHNETDGTPQISTDGIADLAITNEKLSTKEDNGVAAVGTNNIKNFAVTNSELANNTIQNGKIKDNTIENSKIKNNTIEFSKLNSSNILTNIFNVIYPVGSIYITTANTCPIANYIGTWEKVSSGRVLQGADESHSAGTTIEAGLPNIKGTHAGHDSNTTTATGAFRYDSGATAGSYSGGGWIASFNAANGEVHKNSQNQDIYRNDVYGKSETVQPPAYVVNIFKRVS